MIKIKKYQIEDYISDATQDALDLKADLVNGKVPASQLPSFVDDVIEVANYAALPIPGATGVIYITLDNNKVFRWTGSVYVEIASGVTNLSYTPGVSDGTVNSDTGTDATIPLAGTVNAGLFSAVEKTKLGGIVAGANVGVVPNAPITGATKTKITYDSKGLVTAGADSTTADIADSTNKRYVTDANLTTIGNQSGTNTGDNATNTQYSGLAALKQDKITLTTTGTSGASTLVGATLNIPQYSGATNLGYNPSPTEGTVTSSTGTSATLPLADGTNAGLLTPAEKTKISNSVPYTGAVSDVNLGEFGIQLGNLEFDNTPTNIPTAAGSMYYNDTDGTLDLKLKGGNVTLQIGQESVIRVVNKTATNIDLLEANYQAVRVTGAQGQRLKVDLAQATNDVLSAETIGLVTETIANNQEGFITTSGLVRGINTTGSLQGETWLDGDVLYLSPTVPGRSTKVKPTAPNHLIIIGYVISAHITQGSIFVKVDNGYELDELHNVKITSAANNNVLAYTSATDIWENKTVATALGFTPANDADVVHLAGAETITGSKTFTSQTILGDGIVGTTLYGLTPQATVGSTTGGVFDIRNTNTNIVAGNTVGTLQFSAKDDGSVAYSTAQIKAITQNGIGTGSSGKTDLIFYTSNGSTPLERVKINDLGLVINSEADSTIASFDVNKSIKSLSTFTYPSLTELTYLKGVTSAIQTQFSGKQNTITLSAIGAAPNANAATLTGSVLNLQPASLNFGGVVTTGTQTIAGAKTFSSSPKIPTNPANGTTAGVVIDDGTGIIQAGSLMGYPSGTELTYVKGVTSSIQTQLNLDASATQRGAVTTGTQTFAGFKTFSSAIKIPANPTNSAGAIVIDSDGLGNIVPASNLTYPNLTELALLKGVTGSSVQTQLNAKVTSVTGTAPVVSSGGTTPAISMAAATSSVDGYLTAANFTTFNNKQDKSLSAYTVMANNTASTADATAQVFKNVPQQVYPFIPAWTVTTSAPTGTTNHTYQWSQIGKTVNVRLNLSYTTGGVGATIVVCPFPTDLPEPLSPSGLTTANANLYYGTGLMTNTNNSQPTTLPTFTSIRRNAANTGYELTMSRASNAPSFVYISIQYFAA